MWCCPSPKWNLMESLRIMDILDSMNKTYNLKEEYLLHSNILWDYETNKIYLRLPYEIQDDCSIEYFDYIKKGHWNLNLEIKVTIWNRQTFGYFLNKPNSFFSPESFALDLHCFLFQHETCFKFWFRFKI